jgi:hypothetical protein
VRRRRPRKGPKKSVMKDADSTHPMAAKRASAKARAFLVQVAPDCQPGTGALRGRVQHLDTADGGNFACAEDLIAIVTRVLSDPGPGDGDG